MNASMHLRTLFGLSVLAASGLASAQTNDRLDPVQIQAQRLPIVTHLPRLDVSRSCPNYGEELKTSLGRSLKGNIDKEGEMFVTFELKGKDVETVQTTGGPWDYRSPVRRAVRSFECSNDGQANQQYKFQVVFKISDDADNRVAVYSGPQVVALLKND